MFKTSGAFRLPSKFRPALTGVDANVKKSGMSADSTRRVVTFLPTPLAAAQKPTNEDAERPQLAYPSPTHSNLLAVTNRPIDRSPQPNARAIQYLPSPPTSDPPFAFQVPDQNSDDDLLLPFDAVATEKKYPAVRRLTSEVGVSILLLLLGADEVLVVAETRFTVAVACFADAELWDGFS